MHMPAVEVGQRLQSWGAQANNQVATPEQLEAAKAKRIARALAASIAAPASTPASASAPNQGGTSGDGDGSGGGTAYYRSKTGGGQKLSLIHI